MQGPPYIGDFDAQAGHALDYSSRGQYRGLVLPAFSACLAENIAK